MFNLSDKTVDRYANVYKKTLPKRLSDPLQAVRNMQRLDIKYKTNYFTKQLNWKNIGAALNEEVENMSTEESDVISTINALDQKARAERSIQTTISETFPPEEFYIVKAICTNCGKTYADLKVPKGTLLNAVECTHCGNSGTIIVERRGKR